jgi:RNA polymerase sigma-70 factor (ECF subfamily)
MADHNNKEQRKAEQEESLKPGQARSEEQQDNNPSAGNQADAAAEEEVEKRPKYSEREKVEIFDNEFLPQIDSMYNFAYRLTYDEDDAKDLVQETYLKAFRFIDSFQRGTNAKAWLFRILKNSFINDFRKKSKQPSKVDYQEVETYYNSEGVDESITTDLRIEAVQDMIGDEVSNALNSLAVDFRTVIILCDLEGFTYEEMAKILDIPIGTVRSRLHRARNLLKEKLKSYADSMGY